MSSKHVNTSVFDEMGYGSIASSDRQQEGDDVEHKCTQLESASNLIAVVTGAGMLSLPFTAAAMGWSAIFLLCILLLCFMYSYFLLVRSIEQIKNRHNTPIVVDYVILGREAFGEGGDKIVLILLMSELFLALVSFLINIGVNVNVIVQSVSVEEAIILAAAVSAVLSFLDMKVISKFTSGGNIMTGLTIVALLLSGMYLPSDSDIPLKFKFFDIHGVPVSLGVMAYCFGGHGAFPKIYQSMAEREKYPICVAIVAAFVCFIYTLIIVVGYSYYGCHTQIPVTVNIGSDLQGFDLPNARLVSIFASLGLICNIQATCPIIVLTIGDMYTTARGPHQQGKYVVAAITGCALLIAVFLRGDFLQVCGLVGSFATITSSIFLPIAFYHQLYKHADVSRITYILHGCIICVALSAMCIGVTSSVCGILQSESSVCMLVSPPTNN